jgi:hypothetical protein
VSTQTTPKATALLTDLLLQLRPDWERWLVRSVLTSHPDLDPGDLTIAAVRWAKDMSHTPKGIGWSGAHWHGLGSSPDPHARDRGPRCSACGKPEGRCLTERPGPDDHEFEPVR